MKKTENLKNMLKNRVKDIDKQLMSFNPAQHLTYSAFDVYLDDKYPPVTVGQYAFMPSRVMMTLNSQGYFDMFKEWAEGVDFETIPEYIQLQDEREQTLDWLEEIS